MFSHGRLATMETLNHKSKRLVPVLTAAYLNKKNVVLYFWTANMSCLNKSNKLCQVTIVKLPIVFFVTINQWLIFKRNYGNHFGISASKTTNIIIIE